MPLLTSAVARDIPFDIIQYALYEAMKSRLAAERGRDLVAWENAALGEYNFSRTRRWSGSQM